ncbi:MAG TPA: ABC-F family ATP-binding cassette domain-containing protein [Candidatus Krumholzibacteria bacterium]|nr:ABC-F family ATP-binding cassette domain-containing protein [Candidatus Krumholzibacteria bacterium]HRX50645.1 ABC-F family ATP-binding cassette domain-containing protein [Candidatus Krumholzibacteria bacterium]
MITLTNISKSYGRQILFVETSAQLNPGEKVGLVGPNGAGKTTLFRLITGEEEPDEGVVSVPKRTTIGYFRQDIGEMSGGTVLDETIAGSGRLGELHHELAELEHALADPERAHEMEAVLERYSHVQDEYQSHGGYELEARAREILGGLGFAQDQMDRDMGELSGGWKIRVGMARVLLGRPDVLLMDEPTNHLDIESILWLEQFIRGYPGAVLLTCHDKDFMNRVVSRIVDIDAGEFVSYTGNYDNFVHQSTLKAANQEAAYARQQAMLAKERRFVERFRAQVAKAAQVQSRVKMLDKLDLVEPPRRRRVVEFQFRQPPRSGDDVAELKGVGKAYGPRVIYQDFSLMIRRGERWCVMGRNGAGKSTLLKMVVGAVEPDAGTVRLGASLKVGYFAQQSLDLLDPKLTVLDQIQETFPVAAQATLRNLLGAFHFSGHDVDKPVRVLSGGEKSRLVLAQMLYDPPNFLILDEPTNHLDLETKEMLVEALKDFEGTMLFVSHDRTFLRGLSNRVLELRPGDGADVPMEPPLVYDGSYAEFVVRTGGEAAGVHR